MWKLLRNLALAAILLAGALKLLAWYAVGQDAQRVVAALAPYAQVKYGGLSAGLDGSVSLNDVAVTRGIAQVSYQADRVVLDSPGLLWLLKHALLHDNTLPAQFGVSIRGLKLPAKLPWLDSHWLNPATLVPFESLGCGSIPFIPADYARMGITGGTPTERAEYHYDAAAKTLDLTLTLSAPAFANLVLDAEFRRFDPHTMSSPGFLDTLHVDQLSADYTDLDYLHRRNQFCAQREGITPQQFIQRHLDAVQDSLKPHGVVASAEVLKLYRQLIEQGGQASLLSLPSSNFSVAAWRTSTADDLLRQLNVTARYRDTPPVMFRLSFAPAAAADTDLAAAETPSGTSTLAVAAPRQTSTSLSLPAPTTTPANTRVAAVLPAPATVAPAEKPLPVLVKPAPVKPVPEKPTLASQPGVTPASPPPSRDSLGLHGLDRAEAKLAPPPPMRAELPVIQAHPPELASSAPPPANSTLALVWKPTIERLPDAVPEQHDYSVIDYASLKGLQGKRVRLITEGGKKVEGILLSAGDNGVELRVNRPGGDAQFIVPRSRIRQVQLPRYSSPPA